MDHYFGVDYGRDDINEVFLGALCGNPAPKKLLNRNSDYREKRKLCLRTRNF